MSHGKITDTSIFSCPETTNDYFSLPWDEVGELMVGYNKENANVPQNPEATNLTIAEIVKKEYALRHIFHKSVADAHRRGDIRIHDLGMVDRIYCTGQSPAYIAKYGLNLPDAMTIATPPRHPEVFIGQIIKMSAALQGHFAGAIGWDAFNMFIAPFLEGKTDAEIKQLAQILVFEFSQQAVARGGQSLGYNERIIVYDSICNSIFTPTIGEFVEDYLIYAEDDQGEIADGCFTPSLNRESGMVEWKPITHVFRHSPSTPIKKVTLSGGKEVVVTSDHSLFTINADGEIIEASADDNCATYLSVTDVPNPSKGEFPDEEMPFFEKILPLETKSIEDVDYGFDFVYDIGVKDNENFILPNGIVCHNSVFSDLNLYWEIPAHFRDTEAILPGGVTDGRTYADFADESKRFFKALMEVYMEGDAIGRPFFFPKPDCHITKAFFEEPDWEKGMETLCAVASKMGSPYFIFDRGDKVKLSECCFTHDQNVLVKTHSHPSLTQIGNVNNVGNLTVFHNGSWCKARRIVLPRGDKKLYTITTANQKVVTVTEDHLFPTLGGIKRADELSEEDYITFNQRAFIGEGMSYAQGVLIGAFMGDGSITKTGIVLSMNKEKNAKLIPYVVQALDDWGIEANISHRPPVNNCIQVYIHSKEFKEIILGYVNGLPTPERRMLPTVFDKSIDFRNGILFGMYATDGGNSYRIYSTSPGLIEDMECLITTLGLHSRVDVTDRTDEAVEIRGETFSRNYPLFCIRFYQPGPHRSKKGIYKMQNNDMAFRVSNVVLADRDDDMVYCFEMSNPEEPYFTLPNGMITHNCRLSFELSSKDMEDITKPWRMRYAALQNVTINLPRIAYRTDDLDEYIALMKSMVDLTVQAHMDKKAYISEILQLPNSPLELLNMNLDGMPYLRIDKLSYLVGVLGLNEAVEALCGEDMTSSKGREVAFTIMWEMNEYVTELQNKFGIKLVIEQTPAESTAYGLAKLDMQNYPEQTEKYVKGTKVAPYYTNSTQLPLNTDISPLERIKFEGKMHPLIQAGAITHVWLGETLPDIGGLAKVVERTFTHTSNSQIAFSPEFTTCTECSTTHRGLLDKCPKCDSPYVENITRVTGYFSKTKKWNAGKMAELRDRVRQKV